MREIKSSSCEWLRVSPSEWLNIVEDALNNGFHAVAEKVYICAVCNYDLQLQFEGG